MTWSVNQIKNTIDEIIATINLNENKHKTAFQLEVLLMEKYSDFAQDFPFLVKKIAKRDKMEYLDIMLKGIESIENKEKSIETVEQEIGDPLAERFYYPSLDKDKVEKIKRKVKESRELSN
jgi:hypothetical protein